MEERELISHYQAAEILNVSAPTVYFLTAKGKIKLYPVGKGKFLDKNEVIEYKKNIKQKK
ncbi:MAG: helix-turn-helix domain-containing protein [Thermotogota bacterium]|nr:helix-turn-helix domain-containing protein [Thermotogota bacterium]